MGSNIIELAKLGHERAAELKASCGAVDVRSLAQMISDLATQLEVQLVRGNEQAVQLANAESKCRELAAENAGLKDAIEAVRGVANNSSGISGWHLNGNIATWEEILPEIDDIKTPATDAFLAEVRAQGAEEVASTCRELADRENCSVNMRCSYNLTAERAEAIAAQLRKGAAL